MSEVVTVLNVDLADAEGMVGLFDRILTTPYFYEQGYVKSLDAQGSYTELSTGSCLKSQADKRTIKIERMECLSANMKSLIEQVTDSVKNVGFVSVHAFIAEEGSVSFPIHHDKETVVIVPIEGTKTIELIYDGYVRSYELLEGMGLLIPAGVYHKAVNDKASVMLSFGIEPFLEKRLL